MDPSRGNTEDRRRRRLWVLTTYRADVDLPAWWDAADTVGDPAHYAVPLGEGQAACRCFRCGRLLTLLTLTVDRINPGAFGGKYRRDNIRPSCSDCANKQGGEISAQIRSQVPMVRPGVPELADGDASPDGGAEGPMAVPDVPASGQSDLRRNGQVDR